MTYQENLRKTAEELAKIDNPGSWLGEDEFIIKKYEPLAEYCLKKQAGIYTPLDEDNITNELKHLV